MRESNSGHVVLGISNELRQVSPVSFGFIEGDEFPKCRRVPEPDGGIPTRCSDGPSVGREGHPIYHVGVAGQDAGLLEGPRN